MTTIRCDIMGHQFNFILILTTTVTSTIKPCILLCIIDINECAEGTHTCQQDCTNVLGSFNCSCRTGFSLSSNGFSCNGKLQINTCFTHIHTHKYHTHIHAYTHTNTTCTHIPHTTCANTHIQFQFNVFLSIYIL